MVDLEKMLEMPMDRELDIEIAKLAGYSIYHYDKSYPTSNYFMLMTPDFECALMDDPNNHEFGFHMGERETEAEAWQDAPKFCWSLEATKRLIRACPFKFDLSWDGKKWTARFKLKPSGYAIGESLGFDYPSEAVVKAYIRYWQWVNERASLASTYQD